MNVLQRKRLVSHELVDVAARQPLGLAELS